MNTTTFWLGVDLGKETFVASLAPVGALPQQWANFARHSFTHDAQGMDALCAWVAEEIGGPEYLEGVCMEATGRLALVFMGLLDGRLPRVCVVNPARPKHYAYACGIRDKNDEVDAAVLGLYGMTNQPREYTLPPAAMRELRELCRLRDAIAQERQRCHLRLTDGPEFASTRRHLKAELRALDRRLAAIDRDIDARVQAEQTLANDVKRLTTIPGIGTKTAIHMLAELGDLRSFSRKELPAYVGVHPTQHQSGTSVYRKPKMARGGNARIRALLYMNAMSAIRHNPPLQHFYISLQEKGLPKRAALGAVMRKLLIIARALLVNEQDFQPNHT
jgi:transposase